MHAWLVPLLACPTCGQGLHLLEGHALQCEGPQRHAFRLEGGIPRLLPEDLAMQAKEARTVAAFERQWRRYGGLRRIFGKDPRAMAANLVGARMGAHIDKDWYAGKRVLDAGCGHGRYLRAFAELGAEVVGLDIGRGPEMAGVPLEDERIAVVQGSVLQPPFRPMSFDLVFSDGVIHHTPDAPGAYQSLAALVRPGGAFYVWVYPQEGRLREAVFGAGRALTTRLPGPLLRFLCFLLAPLTIFVRSYSGTRLGQATWAECAQVIHDWIAPPLQSHHTHEEVVSWAQQAGLTRPERLPIPTGLTAWRAPGPSA